MSRLLLRGDYDNRARFMLPTDSDPGRYRNVDFSLPTVTLPSARRTLGNYGCAGCGRMNCSGCRRGLSGVLTPATWQSPKMMLSGMGGDYQSSPGVISSLTPIVTQAQTYVASGGSWISQHPGWGLAIAALVGWKLFKK